jgi:hypothetical protein
MLSGVEHQNFFEGRATEYSKGASRGRWEGAEGVWDRLRIRPDLIQELNDLPTEDLRQVIAHAAGIHAHRDGDGGGAHG